MSLLNVRARLSAALGATVLLTLFCLAGATAAAQETGRRSYAEISVEVLEMNATPLHSPSHPASVEVGWANIAETIVDLDGVRKGIERDDGVPFPWRVELGDETSRTVASARDNLFSNAMAMSELHGAYPTHRSAGANWFSSLDTLLSPESRLTVKLHLSADASGWGEHGDGFYDYFFWLTDISWNGEMVQAYRQVMPLDRVITLSYANGGTEPRRVILASAGFTHVSLAPVPEPASIAMLAPGLVVVFALLRRRKLVLQ